MIRVRASLFVRRAVLLAGFLAAVTAGVEADERKPDDTTTGRPHVVAHRGLLRHAPEDTRPAFRACLELRCGFEMDVRRSKDGHLVCIHDGTLDRTTPATGEVSGLTLAELQRLDAGSWFDPAFRGERIPSVEEVLALVAEYPAEAGLIAVDLKVAGDGVDGDVVRLARQKEVLDRLLFIGHTIREPAVRRRLRQADPAAHVATLANERSELAAAIDDSNSDWVYARFVPSREDVARIRQADKRVFVAGPPVSVRKPANWRAAARAGVDAILTDYPLALNRLLRKADPATRTQAVP